jgi:hypothetical protein
VCRARLPALEVWLLLKSGDLAGKSCLIRHTENWRHMNLGVFDRYSNVAKRGILLELQDRWSEIPWTALLESCIDYTRRGAPYSIAWRLQKPLEVRSSDEG